MFRLSIRKTLSRAIANACQNNRNVYKESVRKNISALMQAENDTVKQKAILMEIRRDYLTKVFDDVIKAMSVSSPTISERIRIAIMEPSVCGVPDRDLDEGVMAGTVYAICYWVINNKQAKPGDCIALNHYQNNVMSEMLQEIDKE